MASELLKKEKEFHKLNEELEVRTKALMQEVDSVMKMQNSVTKESMQSYACSKRPKSKTNVDTGSMSQSDWDYFSEETRNPSITGLTNFFKTKLSILQNELDETKTHYKNKCNETKQLQSDYIKMEEEKNKWQQFSQTQKEQKDKLSNQLTTLNSKLQTKEAEIIALRKENETLKKDLNTANANNTNYELRINRAAEENEKLKSNLKNAKQEEKELRDSHKKEVNELNCVIKRLEKQTTEFMSGFKKQMALIDNLKRQKMHLVSTKLIQMTQDEFSKILDWKPE